MDAAVGSRRPPSTDPVREAGIPAHDDCQSLLLTATDAASLAKTFKAAKTDRVDEILETLASLGLARALEDGRHVAV